MQTNIVKKPPKILIVDDDLLFSQSLKEILFSRGYLTDSVSTAKEALEKIAEDYDIFLIDINLPDKTGLELIEEIKNKIKPPPLTVILTGFSSLATAKKAISVKADAYLEKPINPDRLFILLAQLLKEKQKIDDSLKSFYEIVEKSNIPLAILSSEEIIYYNDLFPIDKINFHKITNKDIKIGEESFRIVKLPIDKEKSLLLLVNLTDKEKMLENFSLILSHLPLKVYLVNENFQIFGNNNYCYQEFKNISYPCYLLGDFCPLFQAKISGGFIKSLKTINHKHWEETCVPLKLNQFLLFFRDCTEEIEKTKELYLTKQEWEKTFDAINDLIIIIDKDFNITKANKKVYQFFKRKDLIGKKCYEIFHQKKEPIINCPFSKTLRTKIYFSEEIEIDRKVFLVSVSPIFDEKGEVIGCVHIARDITNLKIIEENLRKKNQELTILTQQLQASQNELIKTAERLAKANEELTKLSNAKSEFIQILSHEMRTPLTAILEGSNLIYENISDKNLQKIIKLIKNNAQKLFELINDLLDLTKIETGQHELLPQKVDIRKIIEELTENLNVIVKEKGLTLIKEIHENLPFAFIDEKAFYRIIVNLLSNAVKYSKENGKIIIRALKDPQEDKIIILIKDDGIGIPKEEQYKVFQKFAQISHPGYSIGSGTGLGLALCKELIERSGEKIWFESEEHKGTTFYFSVSCYQEEKEYNYYKERELKKAKELNFSLGIFQIKRLTKDIKETDFKIISNFFQDFFGNFLTIRKIGEKLIAMVIGKKEDLKTKFEKLKKLLKKTFPDILIEEKYEKDSNN
ncbi:MAG: ATP-binding protein [candidate division WOR-3 bacterium]|nr:ATP-binding protein [candidate division WOR-3 bacterium]